MISIQRKVINKLIWIGRLAADRTADIADTALWMVSRGRLPACTRIWNRGTEIAQYNRWIQRYECPETPSTEGANDGGVETSFVCLYEPGSLSALIRTMRSLCDQERNNWEMVVAVHESEMESLNRELQQWCLESRAIRLVGFAHRASMSDGLAFATQAAAGTLIVVVDAGDVISPLATTSISGTLASISGSILIYWDEDEIAPDGRRRRPHFKPGVFCSATMLSHNILGHFAVSRDIALEALSQPLRLTRSARQWEYAVRCSSTDVTMCHVPAILYHRAIAHRRPSRCDRTVAVRIAAEALGVENPIIYERRGVSHVTWKARTHLVSIIVPTKDRYELISRCVRSILRETDRHSIEIVLVDNGTTDLRTLDYYEKLSKNERIRILKLGGPFNYSRAINVGTRASTGDMICLLNNDTEAIDRGWLTDLVMWAERADTGVVGPALLYPNGTIQHAGMILGLYGSVGHIFSGRRMGTETAYGCSDWYRRYSSITGACQVFRREVFDAVGGYDESYHLTVSDIDFCLRVERLGLQNLVNPFARLYHREAATRGQTGYSHDEVQALARGLYGPWYDRHYNTNLTRMLPTGEPKLAGEPPIEELFARFTCAVDAYLDRDHRRESVTLVPFGVSAVSGAKHASRGMSGGG